MMSSTTCLRSDDDRPLSWRKYAQANPVAWTSMYPNACDFYKNIAPEIRKRQLGVRDLPQNEQDAFNDLFKIPVEHSDDIGADVVGRYSPGHSALPSWVPFREHITLRNGQDDIEGTLVHELRHALERRIKTDDNSYDMLNGVYGFRGNNILPQLFSPIGWIMSKIKGDEELATTNKQHQFAEYMRLKRALKRAPTAEEYFRHISDMDRYDLASRRRKIQNNYQRISDDAMRERMESVPRQEYEYIGGEDLPKWSDFAPESKAYMIGIPKGVKTRFVPYDLDRGRQIIDDSEKYRKALDSISSNSSIERKRGYS